MRKRELSVPGKHGTYDFELNTYDNRVLSIAIQYVGTSFNDLRLNARDIAAWISQTSYKKLIFDDEPDKYYLAKIYDATELENFFRLGKTTLQLECQPHAIETITSNQDIVWGDDATWGMDIAWDNTDAHIIHF